MPFDFLFRQAQVKLPANSFLTVGSRTIPVFFVRSHKARRYILRVQPDGSLRVTVPRVGSVKVAQAFAERSRDWIAKQLQKQQQQPAHPQIWQTGTAILYRGQTITLQVIPTPTGHRVTVGDQAVPVTHIANVRPAVERHLWRLAARELPKHTLELAELHNVSIHRITVRNQRSRWGSCSRKGSISLNWRLIQAPAFVREYIILHELMHRREANHSARYWQHVAAVCPEYAQAEAWLKQHRGLLR